MMGKSISRTQIEFSDTEISKIALAFLSWGEGEYEDVDGFCKSEEIVEIAGQGYSLSPGRFVGSEAGESVSEEAFSTKMEDLTSGLLEQFAESRRLEELVSKQLKALGYGG
jgi:type I restriction enzyme M protein